MIRIDQRALAGALLLCGVATAGCGDDIVPGDLGSVDGAADLRVPDLAAGDRSLSRDGSPDLRTADQAATDLGADGADADVPDALVPDLTAIPDLTVAPDMIVLACPGFQPNVKLPIAGGVKAAELALIDLNLDGALDLVAGAGSCIAVSLGDGKGGFGASSCVTQNGGVELVAADFDQDGRPDVAFADAVQVWVMLGKGDGTFSAPMAMAAGLNPAELLARDLDGDGSVDLIAANFDTNLKIFPDTLSLFWGKGDGTFSAPDSLLASQSPGDPGSLAVGDLARDGHLDIAATNGDGYLSLFFGNGGRTFAPANNMTNSMATGMALADLNGDAWLDAVVATYQSGTLSVRLNDGTGALGAPTQFPVTKYVATVLLIDLDGDGTLDAVTANDVADSIAILKGDGQGGFGAPTLCGVGLRPDQVLASDLDRDGHLDLIVASSREPAVRILYGK